MKWINCMGKFHKHHRISENEGNKLKVKITKRKKKNTTNIKKRKQLSQFPINRTTMRKHSCLCARNVCNIHSYTIKKKCMLPITHLPKCSLKETLDFTLQSGNQLILHLYQAPKRSTYQRQKNDNKEQIKMAANIASNYNFSNGTRTIEENILIFCVPEIYLMT